VCLALLFLSRFSFHLLQDLFTYCFLCLLSQSSLHGFCSFSNLCLNTTSLKKIKICPPTGCGGLYLSSQLLHRQRRKDHKFQGSPRQRTRPGKFQGRPYLKTKKGSRSCRMLSSKLQCPVLKKTNLSSRVHFLPLSHRALLL
jgi:hypothetical protein